MTDRDDLLHAAALAQSDHPGELEYLFAEKMLDAVLPLLRERMISDAAVAEFGYGWHKVNAMRQGYRKGDRRRAGLAQLAEWLLGEANHD
jgi:hypothetical protein